MHETKKGKQCYFGMKLYISVDSQKKIIYSLPTTQASMTRKYCRNLCTVANEGMMAIPRIQIKKTRNCRPLRIRGISQTNAFPEITNFQNRRSKRAEKILSACVVRETVSGSRASLGDSPRRDAEAWQRMPTGSGEHVLSSILT